MSKLKTFIHKNLSPASILSELMYGLIMVLCTTLTANYNAQGGEKMVETLLYTAVGCNAAWGLIDGFMYVITNMYDRGFKTRLLQKIQSVKSEDEGVKIIQNQLTNAVGKLIPVDQLKTPAEKLYQRALEIKPEIITLRSSDLAGGFSNFLLSVIASIPSAIPFLFIRDWDLALRTSNLVTIILLFVVGYQWAKFANMHRFKTGATIALFGLGLVLFAIQFDTPTS